MWPDFNLHYTCLVIVRDEALVSSKHSFHSVAKGEQRRGTIEEPTQTLTSKQGQCVVLRTLIFWGLISYGMNHLTYFLILGYITTEKPHSLETIGL